MASIGGGGRVAESLICSEEEVSIKGKSPVSNIKVVKDSNSTNSNVKVLDEVKSPGSNLKVVDEVKPPVSNLKDANEGKSPVSNLIAKYERRDVNKPKTPTMKSEVKFTYSKGKLCFVLL